MMLHDLTVVRLRRLGLSGGEGGVGRESPPSLLGVACLRLLGLRGCPRQGMPAGRAESPAGGWTSPGRCLKVVMGMRTGKQIPTTSAMTGGGKTSGQKRRFPPPPSFQVRFCRQKASQPWANAQWIGRDLFPCFVYVFLYQTLWFIA